MGTMTLTQLEDEIRYNLGNRTDLDSRLVTFLNWAQEEIARQYSFRELQDTDTTKPTIDSQDYIVQPTGIKDLLSIRVMDGTSSRKLIYVPERTFDALISKPDEYSEGLPSHYYEWGGNFYLWRIPDKEYLTRIKCIKWPAALSGGGGYSDLLYLDEALCALATAKALDSVDVDEKKIKRWGRRAGYHINLAIRNDKDSYTDEQVKSNYNLSESAPNYWQDPFVRGVR
jgi:hypothetical protein